MKSRTILLVGILTLLLPAAAALAGGWVVVTLESMPEQIHANEQATVSFMVRQHGQTPTHDVSPVLLATHGQSGRQIQVDAQAASEKGLFVAELNLPEAGLWEWSIQIPEFNHTGALAPLTVLPAKASVGPDQLAPVAGLQWPALARWAGLALLAATAVLFVVQRRRGRGAPVAASGD